MSERDAIHRKHRGAAAGRRGAVAALCALLMAAPAGAADVQPVEGFPTRAVGASPPTECEEAGSPSRSLPAERLAHRADSALRDLGAWRRAAALLERSAKLRPLCDPLRFEALRDAARYYRFSGQVDRASATMVEAAEQGARRGDVVGAAHAFIEAASWALEAGCTERAGHAARRATLLAQSPLLEPVRRLHIRGRAATLLELAAEG